MRTLGHSELEHSDLSSTWLTHDREFHALLSDSTLDAAQMDMEHQRVAAILTTGGFGFINESGAIVVRPLPWDTQYFGQSCADITRIYAPNDTDSRAMASLIDAAVNESQRRGIRFLSARPLASQFAAAHQLLKLGFRLVDTSMEIGGLANRFSRRQQSPSDTSFTTRLAEPRDLGACIAIAQTFVASRFFQDPNISHVQAQGVYEQWVRSAMNGTHGKLWIVEADSKQIVGLATIISTLSPLPLGSVGLVVIAPEWRHRGAFDPLIQGCVTEIFRQHKDVIAITSSTQVTNDRALRAFARNGFLPFSSRHVLHRWLD